MHHICNFVRLCFNNNKNTTLKKAQKNIKNKKQKTCFLNFYKKQKKRFLHLCRQPMYSVISSSDAQCHITGWSQLCPTSNNQLQTHTSTNNLQEVVNRQRLSMLRWLRQHRPITCVGWVSCKRLLHKHKRTAHSHTQYVRFTIILN